MSDLSLLEEVALYAAVTVCAIPASGVLVASAGATYASVKSTAEKLIYNPNHLGFKELYCKNWDQFFSEKSKS